MPPLPILSGKEMIAVLKRHEFIEARQKGSHVRMKHGDGRATTVPLHKELDRGTLRAILRQSGLSVDDLLDS